MTVQPTFQIEIYTILVSNNLKRPSYNFVLETSQHV